VSAQAKAISEVVKDFEQSLGNLRPSTRRVYVAGARAAIRAASLNLWESPSAIDLLASIGKSPIEKRVRTLPFLDFLGGGVPKQLVSEEDSAALQNWVIQRLAKQMRFVKNPSIVSRRDTALIAAICAAPARGTPRKWPQNCLTITETKVLLWEVAIQEEVLQLFNFAEKSPAFAILLKSSPLILRHLNKAVFGKTGNFQQNQIFATLPTEALLEIEGTIQKIQQIRD
jgi:hypothetical protein